MLPTTILTQNQKRSVINFAGTCDVYAVWVGLTWPVSCWLRLACWKNLNWKGCRNIHLALFLLKVHSQPGNKHTSRVEFACLILCWLRRSWIIRTASLGMVSRLYNYTTTRNCSLLFPWTMRRWVLDIPSVQGRLPSQTSTCNLLMFGKEIGELWTFELHKLQKGGLPQFHGCTKFHVGPTGVELVCQFIGKTNIKMISMISTIR